MSRKSHHDAAVQFVTAKSWPEKATKTRQYDLLRPNVGQKEPPRLGSTICYSQTWARKSHQDSVVRFVAAKRVPEQATKTRQYDLLSHQDCPEKAAKTRQYDLLRPRAGKKEPLRIGSTICSGQTWARKSHQDSAVRFVMAKCGPERATKTRQYDLLRPNVGQKEPPRLGCTICYGYGQDLARRSHQDSAVRFVTAKRGPERASKTRHYDLLRPRVGQKEPPRLGSTICYGQELIVQKEQPRLGSTMRCGKEFGSTICYGQEWARKSHQDSAVRFGTAKHGPERATKTRQYDLLRPERATKTRQYDLLRPIVGQKEPARLGSTICYGQELATKSHRDSAAAKRVPERATKTRQYDLLRPNVGQKEPSRLSRKSRQDSAIRFVTAKSWQERVTENRQ